MQQTPQQELASAVEQTTTANGATVDSATVGTMQTWIPGTGTQVDISQWSQPGNDTYAQGEVFLSDGNQYSVNISVDRQGIVIWSVQN